MTGAQSAALVAARNAVTNAIDAFVTDPTPGTGLPALVAALQATRQSSDPQWPLMGGADNAAAALYIAIANYITARRLAGTSSLSFPWP